MAKTIETIKHNGLTWIRYQDYTEEVKRLTEELESMKAFNYVATQMADHSHPMFLDFQDYTVNTFGLDIYNLTAEQFMALNKMQLEGPPDEPDDYIGPENVKVEDTTIIFTVNKNLLFTISNDGTITKQSSKEHKNANT